MNSRANNSIFILLLSLPLFLLQTGCKKLVEVDAPVTSTNAANVYNTDANAAAVLTSVYTNISKANLTGGGLISLSLFPGLSADELTLYGGSTNLSTLLLGYYMNALTNSNIGGADFCTATYPIIYTANAAVEGMTNNNSLTPAVRQQLLGEAKFIRAFCYFYLVNLYGDVPFTLSTDYTRNAVLPRTPKAQIYQQVIADLKDAQGLLNDKYLQADALNPYPAGSEERTRPTKWAATALLSRVYLYTGDWPNAESQASLLINNKTQYKLVGLTSVFLKNNSEAIWQLQPVISGWNSQDARLFILPSTGPTTGSSFPVYLSNNVVNAFETGDQRKSNWTGNVTVTVAGVPTTYYYPAKYKIAINGAPVTEYMTVLRLGEQYLIRAEARSQQGNGSGAEADLDSIRVRAGLPVYSGSTDKLSLSAAILHERQVELFTEWGHRWLDLKRTNTVDAVMGGSGGSGGVTAQKGGKWSSDWQWYPFQLGDLQKDPNLVQNPSY